MSAASYLQEQGFQDPFSYSYGSYNWNNQYTDTTTGHVNTPHGVNSFGDKIADWLGVTRLDETYQKYLSDLDKQYERESTNSARAWDLWMDSTKTQRLVKDLQAAGLNPWLALQSGFSAGSVGQTAGSGSSARYHSKGEKQSGVQKAAMLLFTVAKLFALFA